MADKSYFERLLSLRPLSLYKLNETLGNIIDYSGNGYTATVTGSPSYQNRSISNFQGEFGASIDFGLNNTNESHAVASASARPTADMTFVVDIMRTGSAQTGEIWYLAPAILDCETGGNVPDYGWGLRDVDRLYWGTGSSDVTNLSDYRFPLNTPVNLILTRNNTSGQVKLYINGKYIETINGGAGTRSSANAPMIGKSRGGGGAGDCAPCKLQNFAMFDRELSHEEIQYLADIRPTTEYIAYIKQPSYISYNYQPEKQLTKPTGEVTIDWSHPQARGLFASFDFIEGQPVQNDSTQNYHPALVGTTVRKERDKLVSDGDANSDRIDLGSVDSSNPFSLLPYGSMIARVWLDPDFASSNPYPRIFDKSSSVVGTGGWCLLYDDDVDSWRFETRANEFTDVAEAKASATGRWVDIAITHDSTLATDKKKIYVKGVGSTFGATGTVGTSTTNAAIANWNHSTDRNWSGEIDYIHFYNRPLTEKEINQHWADPFAYLKTAANEVDYSVSYFPPATGGFDPQESQLSSGALALTGNAGTTDVNGQFSNLVAGAISFSGLIPGTELTANVASVPALGALALTGGSISADTNFALAYIPTGTFTVTGLTPSTEAYQSIVVQNDIGALSLTGNVPDISVFFSQFANLPAGALSLSGFTPDTAFTQAVYSEPPAGNIALTGYTAQVDAPANVISTLSSGALTISGLTPTVTYTGNVYSRQLGVPANIAISGFVPGTSYTLNKVVDLNSGAVALSGIAPTTEFFQFAYSEIGQFGSIGFSGFAPAVESIQNKLSELPVGALRIIKQPISIMVGTATADTAYFSLSVDKEFRADLDVSPVITVDGKIRRNIPFDFEL